MPKKPARPKSYAQMSQELQQLLEWFEQPDPDLDESLRKYEQAASLIAQMEKYLKTAQIKIKKITPRAS